MTETEQATEFAHVMTKYLNIERKYHATNSLDKKKDLIRQYLEVLRELCELSFSKTVSPLGATAHVHHILDLSSRMLTEAIPSQEDCSCSHTKH